MIKTTLQDLLKAKVHLGHQRKWWNPKMASYIFAERKGFHIIDLNKTLDSLEKTRTALKNIVESGRKILFVATKRQVGKLVEKYAQKLKQPYVTERWLGGTLTNFATIRKSLKKLANIHKIKKSIHYQNLAKREKLMLEREQTKLEILLKGLVDINRVPSAIFVVDIKNEAIAVQEAKKLGIPVFGIVDTNSDPTQVDYAIPANDDNYSSIEVIFKSISDAIEEGLENRKKTKELNPSEKVDETENSEDVNEKEEGEDISSKKNVKKITSSDSDKIIRELDKNRKVSKKVISKKIVRNMNKPEKGRTETKK